MAQARKVKLEHRARPVALLSMHHGAQYPARNEDLRRQAQQNNADDDVLVVIDALPEGPFKRSKQSS